MSTSPRYRLLGPVGASLGEADVDLGGPKPRAVLALLVLDVGRTVAVDRLIEEVWEGDPPPKAETSLRGYVSGLRKALGGDPARIEFADGGYRLRAADADIDARRFEALVAEGQAALRRDDAVAARTALAAALVEWRGTPLGSLGDLPGVREDVMRLVARQQEAADALVDARLALGEHDALVAELGAAVAAEPLRERRRAQLAVALYRAGRPVDALRSIDEARQVLAEEVGVVLGPELVALERSILEHDASLGPSAPAPPPGSGSPAVPGAVFVGRERELAQLTGALGPAGSGGVVLVSGEAGMGKTALVRRALAAASGGRTVAWGQCVDVTTGSPLRPWRAVAAALGSAALESAVAGGGPGEDPTAARLRVAAAVGAALRAAGRPIVVLDDLQWADEASLRLLELLAVDGPDVPAVVVATLRTPLVEPEPALVDCLGSVARVQGFVRISLAGLAEDELGRWAATSAGAAIDPDLGARLRDRTDGNPFFARELLAVLAGGGSIEQVPAAVQDVLRRRLSRLPASTHPALRAAAVVGQNFEVDVVAGMLGLGPGEVLEVLGPAVDTGLVVRGDEPGQLAFVHGLVAETIVAELNPVRAAQLHAGAAAATADRRGVGPDTIDALARHAYEGLDAGTAVVAVDWCESAGERAASGHAYGAASGQFSRALRALRVAAAGDRGRRLSLLLALGSAQARGGEVVSARSTLADAAELAETMGEIGAMAAALAQVNADDLWSSLDWSHHDERTVALLDRALAAVGPSDSAARAELLAAKAAQLYYGGAGDELAAVSAAAVAVATRVGEPATMGRVLLQRYWAMWRPSSNAERTEAAAALVALVDEGVLPAPIVPVAHLARFAAAYERGDLEVANASLAAARAASDPLRTPAAWSYVLYGEVSLSLLRGSYEEASAQISELHAAFWRTRRFVAETTRAALVACMRSDRGETESALGALAVFDGSAYGPSMAWLRAWILAEGGRRPEAAAALASFDGPLVDDWYRVVILTAAVHAAATVGDTRFLSRHAGGLADAAGLVAQAGSGGVVLGPVDLALGRAAAAQGDAAGARGLLASGIDLAERLGATPWVARGLAARWELDGTAADRAAALELAEGLGMAGLAARLH